LKLGSVFKEEVMGNINIIFYAVVIFVSLSSSADESYNLTLINADENNLELTINNKTNEVIKLEHTLCFTPHRGVAFLIESLEGQIFNQTSTLNSGCNLSEQTYVPSGQSMSELFEKGLLRFIYHLPYEKLYVTAFMCDNFFSIDNCLKSNRLLIDFNHEFK
jgi:hypothetical protein